MEKLKTVKILAVESQNHNFTLSLGQNQRQRP